LSETPDAFWEGFKRLVSAAELDSKMLPEQNRLQKKADACAVNF